VLPIDEHDEAVQCDGFLEKGLTRGNGGCLAEQRRHAKPQAKESSQEVCSDRWHRGVIGSAYISRIVNIPQSAKILIRRNDKPERIAEALVTLDAAWMQLMPFLWALEMIQPSDAAPI
jgi:hypothetical protein